MTTTRRLLAGVISGSAILGACLSSACDDRGPLADALDAATHRLAALSPGGSAAAADAYKTTVYSEVLKTLERHAGKGTPSQNAAALVLMAQARAGLADVPADQVTTIERDSQHTLKLIEASLQQWTHHSAQAAAAAAFDPAPELAEIDRQSAERDADVKQSRDRKAQVDARVAQLRAESAAKASQAKIKRGEESALARQASNESAVRAEEIMKQASKLGREADALEAQAADLEAQAANVEPQSRQIEIAIDRLTSQRALLDKARAEVLARAATAAEQAKASRESAQNAARDIDRLASELSALRAAPKDGRGPYEMAVDGYSSAAATADKAATEASARGLAKLTAGSARQALGDLHWSRAHGLARVLETFEALGKSRPALPTANRYQAQSNELRRERTAALEAATEAYQAAVQAYQAAGSTGDAQARLQRVSESLARCIKLTSGGKVDLLAEMRSSGTSSAASAAGGDDTSNAPLAALRDTIAALKEGRGDDLVASLHLSDPQNRRVLDAVPAVLRSVIRLDRACRDRLGTDLAQLVSQQLAAAMPMLGGASGGVPDGLNPSALFTEGMSSIDPTIIDAFRAEVDGDTATVFPPESMGGQPLTMRLVDGRWRIDLSDVEAAVAATPEAPKYRELIVFAAPLLTQVLDGVAAELEAGGVATVDALTQALQSRMGLMMMQVMGKMQELGIQMPGMPGAPGVPPPGLPRRGPGGG